MAGYQATDGPMVPHICGLDGCERSYYSLNELLIHAQIHHRGEPLKRWPDGGIVHIDPREIYHYLPVWAHLESLDQLRSFTDRNKPKGDK